MQQTSAAEYRARVVECTQRAEQAQDADTKAEWLKLAMSWQVLADRNTDKNF